MVREVNPPRSPRSPHQSPRSPRFSRTPRSPKSSQRSPLQERSVSRSNEIAAVRLPPTTFEQLEEPRDEVYSRSALPTAPEHVLRPGGVSSSSSSSSSAGTSVKKEDEAQRQSQRGDDIGAVEDWRRKTQRPGPLQGSAFEKGGDVSGVLLSPRPPLPVSGSSSPRTPTQQLHQSASQSTLSSSSQTTTAPIRVPKKPKVLTVHPDKTFSVRDLLRPSSQYRTNERHDEGLKSPRLSLSTKSSRDRLSSDNSCPRNSILTTASSIDDSALAANTPISSYPGLSVIANPAIPSQGDISLVGGERKAPSGLDLKQKGVAQPLSDPSPLSPLAETSQDESTPRDLASKPSFQSDESRTTRAEAENSDSQVYENTSASQSSVVIHRQPSAASSFDNTERFASEAPPSSPPPSSTGSVIHHRLPSFTPSLEGSDQHAAGHSSSSLPEESTVIHHTQPSYPPSVADTQQYEVETPLSGSDPIEPNYEILGRTSPAGPSSSEDNSNYNSNWEILGRTSPAGPSSSENNSSSIPNYEILGRTSPAGPSSSGRNSNDIPNYEVLGRTSPSGPSSSRNNSNWEIVARTSSIGQSSSRNNSNYEVLGRTSSVGQSSRNNSNYEIVGRTSSVGQLSVNSNYQILGRTSPAEPASPVDSYFQSIPPSSPPLAALRDAPSLPSLYPGSPAENYLVSGLSSIPPSIAETSENYQVLGQSSVVPSAAASVAEGSDNSKSKRSRTNSPVRAERQGSQYSQNSLVVPPLRPRAQRSTERLGYYASRSRENLRRQESVNSLTQEVEKAAAGASSVIGSARPGSAASSWAGRLVHPLRSHMTATPPHQWSAQLSTVPSESEPGSAPPPSRDWSASSFAAPRSSGLPSTHRSQILSISSSLARELDTGDSPQLERPQTAYYARAGRRPQTGQTLRVFGDDDENDDTIADLHDLHHRPSRTRLSRSNSFTSTASSIATNFLQVSVPTWARLYYGSGERRALPLSPSSVDLSESRPASAQNGPSRSPDPIRHPLGIYSPRRRPHVQTDSMVISPALGGAHWGSDGIMTPERAMQEYGKPKRMTSSVWSPHLRIDRRANRLSIWEPPSISWSTEGRWTGRRNAQIGMFIVGFVFPLAWMIASFLPLPPYPEEYPEMEERPDERTVGTTQLETSREARRALLAEESRYESARWWRLVNRFMTPVGLVIIAGIVSFLSHATSCLNIFANAFDTDRRYNHRDLIAQPWFLLPTFVNHPYPHIQTHLTPPRLYPNHGLYIYFRTVYTPQTPSSGLSFRISSSHSATALFVRHGMALCPHI